MSTAQTKLFVSNRSQALRLPKAVAYPAGVGEVEVVAIGNRRIISPVGESWDDWFAAEGVSSDFMCWREQPADQFRDTL